jgi:hypothetical protein
MSGEQFVIPRSSRREEAYFEPDRGSMTRSNPRSFVATSTTQASVQPPRRAKRHGLRRLDAALHRFRKHVGYSQPVALTPPQALVNSQAAAGHRPVVRSRIANPQPCWLDRRPTSNTERTENTENHRGDFFFSPWSSVFSVTSVLRTEPNEKACHVR